MDKVVAYFNTIESSLKKSRVITVAVIVMAAVISLGSLVYAMNFVSSHSDNIYVLDGNGQVASATVSGGDRDRSIEVRDHVKRFHELMFNLYPVRDQIVESIESALAMCDRSAYEYYNDQQEKGYYSRLISANVSQYIVMDSIRVDMRALPYQERYYGKLYILRQSNITAYSFESVGQLMEVGRSKDNPHGLMMERFAVVRNERIDTKQRSR